MKVAKLLTFGSHLLAGQPAGRLEAEVLLCDVLDVSRAWLYANPEREIPPDRETRFLDLAERRKAGEPVAYLTGRREFWSLTLKVTADVLIPRAETEVLVETVLAAIPGNARWRVADLGTGSGAVALAIASERPLCEVHATDFSEAALAVARENAGNIAPDGVHFHHGSWLEPLHGRFHVIASNPPYIAENDPHLRIGDCRFEPSGALISGQDGLDAIRHIARKAHLYLEPGGLLALEHGYDQGGKVREILERLGYAGVETRKDPGKLERVTVGIPG
jgi:release factor glutamine methyltransferase